MKLRFFTLILCCFFTGVAFAQPKFVGLTRGTTGRLIEYSASSTSVASAQPLPNNALPWYNDLVQTKNGVFYGMAEAGGKGFGILFSYDPASKIFDAVYEFEGGSKGASPYGSLVEIVKDDKTILYGMTQSGGTSGHGTIFSFDVSTKTLTTLYSFNGTNGRSPYGSLTLAKNGLLYGMTESGGTNDMGTIFSFDPGNNNFKLLHSFELTDGRSPYGSLIQASDGNLYGLAQFGGTYGYGVIFSIGTSGGGYTVKASFNWTDGAWPNSTLVEANGKLYGITESGGANNYGAIFSIPVGGTLISKVSDFDNINGRSPYGKLTLASDGKLYGMTFRGGTEDKGVIFDLDPTATSATIKPWVSFSGTNGMNPAASLTELKASTPLPLTLTSFTARAENQKVKLLWEVEKELDIEKYEVERSTDGIQFTAIGAVAAINSPGARQYSYTDEQPSAGNNYYRLKIHEKYEAPHYSAVKLANMGMAGFKATVQPNPVQSNANLHLRLTAKSKVQLHLYNAQGVLVKQWPAITYEKGEQHIPLQLGSLASGSYVLLIDAGATRQTLQLIKSGGN